MPLSLRLHHTGVSGMKNMFDKKVEDHKKTQLDNPFSEWEGAGQTKGNFTKDDEFYGRPLPGTQSERRAQAAQHHIMMDIRYLCDMIWDCAEFRSPDGRAAITFGKLFNLYNAINDKVVGTLLRARKYGFLYFEGEMLYQRRDDDKVIELNRNINTIRSRFGAPPLESGGGDVEKWRNSNEEDNTPSRNSSPEGEAAKDNQDIDENINGVSPVPFDDNGITEDNNESEENSKTNSPTPFNHNETITNNKTTNDSSDNEENATTNSLAHSNLGGVVTNNETTKDSNENEENSNNNSPVPSNDSGIAMDDKTTKDYNGDIDNEANSNNSQVPEDETLIYNDTSIQENGN